MTKKKNNVMDINRIPKICQLYRYNNAAYTSICLCNNENYRYYYSVETDNDNNDMLLPNIVTLEKINFLGHSVSLPYFMEEISFVLETVRRWMIRHRTKTIDAGCSLVPISN